MAARRTNRVVAEGEGCIEPTGVWNMVSSALLARHLGILVQYLTRSSRSSCTVIGTMGSFQICCCRMQKPRDVVSRTTGQLDRVTCSWICSSAFDVDLLWRGGCAKLATFLAFVVLTLLGGRKPGARSTLVSWSGVASVWCAKLPLSTATLTHRKTYPSHSAPLRLQLIQVGSLRSHFRPRRRHVLQAIPNKLFRLISKVVKISVAYR